MSKPVQVTETTIYAPDGLYGTPELDALREWCSHFGIDPDRHPVSRPMVRDLANRRIIYAEIDLKKRGTSLDPDDFITDCFVQLEAGPPPWPYEIRRHINA